MLEAGEGQHHQHGVDRLFHRLSVVERLSRVEGAGVAQVTKVMALEWRERGVRVNGIGPTLMESPMTRKAAPDNLADRRLHQGPNDSATGRLAARVDRRRGLPRERCVGAGDRPHTHVRRRLLDRLIGPGVRTLVRQSGGSPILSVVACDGWRKSADNKKISRGGETMAKRTTSGLTGDSSDGTVRGLNRRQIIKGASAAGVTAAALPGLLEPVMDRSVQGRHRPPTTTR